MGSTIAPIRVITATGLHKTPREAAHELNMLVAAMQQEHNWWVDNLMTASVQDTTFGRPLFYAEAILSRYTNGEDPS